MFVDLLDGHELRAVVIEDVDGPFGRETFVPDGSGAISARHGSLHSGG
jgi:hypothetical protein